jgi:hypothetical protein
MGTSKNYFLPVIQHPNGVSWHFASFVVKSFFVYRKGHKEFTKCAKNFPFLQLLEVPKCNTKPEAPLILTAAHPQTLDAPFFAFFTFPSCIP